MLAVGLSAQEAGKLIGFTSVRTSAPTTMIDQTRRMFDTLNGANRYAILYRVHHAKKPETRKARIEKFIAMLERGELIHPKKP